MTITTLALPKITCNDQTFYIGGEPHQLVQDQKRYKVCKIIKNPQPGYDGLLRVEIHAGTLVDCFDFLSKHVFLYGEYAYNGRR